MNQKSKQKHNAAWSNYNHSYVQNIINGILKSLTLLAAVSLDPGLYMWVSGLKNHLNKQIEEAKRDKEKADSYKF